MHLKITYQFIDTLLCVLRCLSPVSSRLSIGVNEERYEFLFYPCDVLNFGIHRGVLGRHRCVSESEFRELVGTIGEGSR